MFGSIPQPAYMPCEECGVSLAPSARDSHVCSETRRLDFQMTQLRPEIEAFDERLTVYLESPQGRFEAWYAERARRRA
jgi:hypothetical protein